LAQHREIVPVHADDDGVAGARQYFADTFLQVGLDVPVDSGVSGSAGVSE
jgi:hypothetical protein